MRAKKNESPKRATVGERKRSRRQVELVFDAVQLANEKLLGKPGLLQARQQQTPRRRLPHPFVPF